ncbi:unnamed protein product, partial [marine sediment metagenome]
TETAEIICAVTGEGSKSSAKVGVSNLNIAPGRISVGSSAYNSTLEGKSAREASKKIAKEFAKELGQVWKGAIVKITEDGIVYINGGENVGVKKKNIFKVVRKGESLIDPETGEELGSEDEIIGEIKVFKVLEKMSKAKKIEGSGFKRGDRIQESN